MRPLLFAVPLLLILACGDSASSVDQEAADAGPGIGPGGQDAGSTPDSAVAPDAAVAPSSPTEAVASANVTQGVRLTWKAPAVGGAITSYTVAMAPLGGNVRISGTSAVITGLTVGESYTFTIRATNGAGTGPSSESTMAVTVVDGPTPPASFIACGADQIAQLRADVKLGGPNNMKGAPTYNAYFDGAAGVSMLTPARVAIPALPFTHSGRKNAAKLYYVITAVDAKGVESVESAEDATTPDSAVHDSMFVTSYIGTVQAVEIVDCFSKLPTGVTPPARLLKGASTTIQTTMYNTIAVDGPRALLYYRKPTSILVFANATTITGDVAPVRNIAGSLTKLTNGGGVALDATRDIFYVMDSSGAILVYPGASSADGNVAPARSIAGAATKLGNAYALWIDVTNDRLYVAVGTNVLVFDGASTATGNIAPKRIISAVGETQPSYGVTVDATKDVLYASARSSGAIHTFVASTADGATAPVHSVTGVNVPMGLGVFNDKLIMISDNSGTLVSQWSNAATVNGATAPDKVISLPTMVGTGAFAYVP